MADAQVGGAPAPVLEKTEKTGPVATPRGKRDVGEASRGAAGPCVVGVKSTIRGNVSGDEDLVVQGRVEGQIALSKRLSVEVGGVIEADCEVAELHVAGELRGDVTARTIAIASGATVVGTLRAPRISIEDGAHFSGAIDMDVELPDGAKA
jgi:cytoskeletal protein CcmA (bactofilin family)